MISVGIDLVAVGSVSESIDTYGDAYLQRVFTSDEIEGCRTPDGLAHERLAARFAAKEAVLKALRVGPDTAIDLRSIELVPDPGGSLRVRLTGTALAYATRSRINDLSVSVTHEDGFAAAVVLASVDDGDLDRP